jgi:5-methylcytosine-specific restriction protein A
MPFKANHPCAYPGCPALIRAGRYCDAHKTLAARAYNQTRSSDHNRTYGCRWHTIRDRYISNHPLCEQCLKSDRFVPADEVHHITPTTLGGGHADNNLMALCKSCHAHLHTNF